MRLWIHFLVSKSKPQLFTSYSCHFSQLRRQSSQRHCPKQHYPGHCSPFTAAKVHMPDEQEHREILIQVVSPPLQAGPGSCHPPKCTAGWSTLVLTSGSCHHHLKGCYSCLAGVHSERLWDFGSNRCSQTRSCNLHLAGIHNILHRNLERTAWKRMQQVLNTTELTGPGNHRTFSPIFPQVSYYNPSTSGRNDNLTVSTQLLCFCKSQKCNYGASTFSLPTQQLNCDPSASHTSEKKTHKRNQKCRQSVTQPLVSFIFYPAQYVDK